MFNVLRSHGLQPTRLPCPWNSPGKNTGVCSHSLLQGIFPTQGSNMGLLHCRQILYHLSHQGSPGSIPGLGRSPGEGNGYPLQYSCLGNLMDRGDQRVAKESDMTEQLSLHFISFQGICLVWDYQIVVFSIISSLTQYPTKPKTLTIYSIVIHMRAIVEDIIAIEKTGQSEHPFRHLFSKMPFVLLCFCLIFVEFQIFS